MAAALPRKDEVCLIIEAPSALALLRMMAEPPTQVVTRFGLLDRAMLERVRPTRVVIPLIAPGFDAVQALGRLVSLGYQGPVCVLSDPLPDVALVRAELQAVAPGLTLHLLAFGAPAPHAGLPRPDRRPPK